MLKRFIKLPIRIYAPELENLTGRDSDEKTTMRVNPLEICAFHPTSDELDGAEDLPHTQVVLKNGKEFVVLMRVEKFEELIDKF